MELEKHPDGRAYASPHMVRVKPFELDVRRDRFYLGDDGKVRKIPKGVILIRTEHISDCIAEDYYYQLEKMRERGERNKIRQGREECL